MLKVVDFLIPTKFPLQSLLNLFTISIEVKETGLKEKMGCFFFDCLTQIWQAKLRSRTKTVEEIKLEWGSASIMMGREIRVQTQRQNPGSLAERGNSSSIGFNRTGPPEDCTSVSVTHSASPFRSRALFQSFLQSRPRGEMNMNQTGWRSMLWRVFVSQLEVAMVQLFQLILNTGSTARSLKEKLPLSTRTNKQQKISGLWHMLSKNTKRCDHKLYH